MTTTKVFTCTVNNVKFDSRYEKLTALEVLELAAQHSAIDGKPDDYSLQSLKDDGREYKAEDTVDLTVDNEFIALLSGSTMVA